MPEPVLSYLSISHTRSKVVCICGWESEEFTRSPFDPKEALVAFSVDHLQCSGPAGVSNNSIQIWSWDKAPQHLKDLSAGDGDEDGVAWIPIRFQNPNQLGPGFTPNVERIWMLVDEDPEVIKFESGILVIWRHS